MDGFESKYVEVRLFRVPTNEGLYRVVVAGGESKDEFCVQHALRDRQILDLPQNATVEGRARQ